MAPLPPPSFVSKPVDFLFAGGLSIVQLLLFSLTDIDSDVTSWALAAGWLTWVVNYPHFSATSHRLYQSRTNIMQFPVTALAVPVIVLLMTAASLAQPTTVAPWFLKLYLFWSAWHFSAQSLGVALLYAHRSGFVVDAQTRRCLSAFIYASFICPAIYVQTKIAPVIHYGVPVPSFMLPAWIGSWVIWLTLLPGTALVLSLYLSAQRQKRRVPFLMMTVLLAQTSWFLLGRSNMAYQAFVPGWHSLQYLFIAWAVQLHTRIDRDGKRPSLFFASVETLRWFLLNCFGGFVLFALFPYIAWRNTDLPFYVVFGIVIAGVQIHHFFVDGVIWKLRTSAIRQPLMTNWAHLTGRSA